MGFSAEYVQAAKTENSNEYRIVDDEGRIYIYAQRHGKAQTRPIYKHARQQAQKISIGRELIPQDETSANRDRKSYEHTAPMPDIHCNLWRDERYQQHSDGHGHQHQTRVKGRQL